MTDQEIDNANEKAWVDRLHDVKEAYNAALKLIEWSESINYQRGIADSCKTLGYCYWRFSDYSLSLSHSLRALKIYEKLGNRKGEADTLNNIGAVYMFQNDNVNRLDVNLKCKKIREEIGDLEGVSSSEGNIGETYFEMGDYENAVKCFQSVLSDKNSSPQGLAWSHYNLGRVACINEEWEKAHEAFLKGLEISESVDYTVLITDSRLAIVDLLLRQDRLDEALGYAEKALKVSRQIGAKEGEKMALYYLSKIYEVKGMFEESLRYHKDYHTLDRDIAKDTEIERLKTAQLQVALDKIEEQKDELVDSIKYAQRIQDAVLTRDQQQTLLKNYAVFYQPKDIVSGDFYWYQEKDDTFYLCVADCTGHGVPGAFLTMLGTTYMNEIISLNDGISPADFLEELRKRIIEALTGSELLSSRDGMDLSMIRVNAKTLVAEWSGANNPLWILRDKKIPYVGSDKHQVMEQGDWKLIEYKADKQPIGMSDNILPFRNHRLQLEPTDVLYFFTDGFADQFGGPRGKKYKTLNLKRKLLEIQNHSVEEQMEILESEFFDWKGDQQQVDDVCILNFQL